ncbi:MAG: hypothetical protein HYX78_10270 [Armatimonadetes bacterium]|nr:hypothetical protein [Armatimonadota bacterium]
MKAIVIIVAVLLAAGAAYSGDIVTVPTANQLKAGEIDVAYYYLGLDMPVGLPSSLQAQTVYIGLTDRIELDVHRYDPEKALDKTSTIVNASLLILGETAVTPAIVIGGRNITGETTTNGPVDSDKRSWFISAAKNVTPMLPGGPKLPLVRLHASLGTKDWTLLGEDRHAGLFGGVQALLTPEIGAIALHDGQDLITGLTYTPKNRGLTIKGGGFGKHWWSGISYARSL